MAEQEQKQSFIEHSVTDMLKELNPHVATLKGMAYNQHIHTVRSLIYRRLSDVADGLAHARQQNTETADEFAYRKLKLEAEESALLELKEHVAQLIKGEFA